MRNAPKTIDLPSALVRNSDSDFRKFVLELTASSARMVEVREAFGRRISVSGVQYNVLIAVAHLEGEEGVGVGDIALALHLPPSQITREVNACILRNFLSKRGHATDGRRVSIKLTVKGEAAIMRLVPFIRDVNNILFSNVSKEEIRVLKRFLKKFTLNTQNAVAFISEQDSGRSGDQRIALF